MDNPFKAGDTVLIKIKGQQVEATVNQVWNQEVQVRTADKKLLWRTVKTVALVCAAVQSATKSDREQANNSQPTPSPEASAPKLPHAQPLKQKSKPVPSPSLRYERKRPRHRKRPKI